MVQPTIDRIADTTVERQIRKLAGVVDEVIADQQDTTDLQNTVDNHTQQINSIKQKDSQQDISIETLGNRVTTLESDMDVADLKDKVDRMDAELTSAESAIATNQNNIAKVEGKNVEQDTRIGNVETDVAGLKTKDTSQDANISQIKAIADEFENRLTSGVAIRDGTNNGTVQVELTDVSGTKITSANYQWGKTADMKLVSGSSEGMFKSVITLSDGTVIESNEYQVTIGHTGEDIYVTAITLTANVDNATIGGTISYSNGTTQTINAVNVPTAPGVTSAIESLQTRMTAVEQKNALQDTNIEKNTTDISNLSTKVNTNIQDISAIKEKNAQQDGELSALDTRIGAIEDAGNITKFENGKLGTIMGSTVEGNIGANTDGTGYVNGFSTLKGRVDTHDTHLQTLDADIEAFALAKTGSNNVHLVTPSGNGTEQPIVESVGINVSDDNKLQVSVNNIASPQVQLPSGGSGGGGEVWEEIDINNFPTDWTADDRVKVLFRLAPNGLTTEPNSWDSLIIANMPTEFDVCNEIYEFKLKDTSSDIIKGGVIGMDVHTTYILFTFIDYVGGYQNWNTLTRPYFTFKIVGFNGASISYDEVQISDITMGLYIKKMWRLKK